MGADRRNTYETGMSEEEKVCVFYTYTTGDHGRQAVKTSVSGRMSREVIRRLEWKYKGFQSRSSLLQGMLVIQVLLKFVKLLTRFNYKGRVV